jgi:hypothetical protein
MNPLSGAIDGLVAAFAGIAPDVFDGPPSESSGKLLVAVGVGSLDVPEFGPSDRYADLSGGGRSQFMVPCLVRSWSGDDSVRYQREQALSVLDKAQAVVRGDVTLGNRVSRARWDGATYRVQRTDRGQLVVDLPFRVEIIVL